ncbi:hypothetical protein WNY37_16480 [Henriciella sp. AS95]|uniref:hypothetical protein n=1 Tax=Henriciella sp. AS95 TaxID=3135782 RepID=UPI003172FD3B
MLLRLESEEGSLRIWRSWQRGAFVDEEQALADLTPVERSVLVALMAEGGPLKEAADLGARYGIRMTGWHRKRLSGLGLVKTTKAPFTHELTDEGWAFLASDFPMDVPQVSMKLGAMNALLAGVRQRVGADGSALKAFFTGKGGAPASDTAVKPAKPKPETAEKDLMAEAAWSESETMLAMALQAMPAFDGRFGALEKTLDGQGEAALKQVSLAAENVFQNLRMAASKRGLEALHKRNETVAFDPVYFEATEDMDDGEDAIVMKQPIIRVRDGDELVILRGLATPLD